MCVCGGVFQSLPTAPQSQYILLYINMINMCIYSYTYIKMYVSSNTTVSLIFYVSLISKCCLGEVIKSSLTFDELNDHRSYYLLVMF